MPKLPRLLTLLLLSVAPLFACGVNLASNLSSDANTVPTASPQAPATSPDAGTTGQQPNSPLDANAGSSASAAEPNVVVLTPVEPALALGYNWGNTVVVSPNTAANATPLKLTTNANQTVGSLSLYGGKLYSAAGCIGLEYKNGGFLVLRPCADSNSIVWSLYKGASYSCVGGIDNCRTWNITQCPDAEGQCLGSHGASSTGQAALNVVHTKLQPEKTAQGVMIHLIAEPNSCLSDDGTPTLRLKACDLNDPGQQWVLPFMVYKPQALQSGRNNCFARSSTDGQPTRLACDQLTNIQGWFIDESGHLGLYGTGSRFYLIYDDTAKTLAYTAAFKRPKTAVWGLGPYPQQLVRDTTQP